MKTIVISFLGTFIFIISVFSQCENLLNDKLMKEVDVNAKVLKTFNVELEQTDNSGVTPFAKFPMNFEIGKKYEFIVVWDTVNYNTRAILQHYFPQKNKIIGSNYQQNKNIMHHSYYFQNPSVELAEIWLNFEHGNAGCAIIAITEIIE